MKTLKTENLDLDGLRWVLGKIAVESEAEGLELNRKGFFSVCPAGDLPDLEKEIGLPVPFVYIEGRFHQKYWCSDWMSRSLPKAQSLLYEGARIDFSRPTMWSDGSIWKLHLGSWGNGQFMGWSGAWRGRGRIGEVFDLAIDTLDIPVERIGRRHIHTEGGLVESTPFTDHAVSGFIRCSLRADESISQWISRLEKFPWGPSSESCKAIAVGPPRAGHDPEAIRIWNAALAVFPEMEDQNHRVDFEIKDLSCLERLRQAGIPMRGDVSHGHFRFEGGSNIRVRVEVDSSTSAFHVVFKTPDPEDEADLEELLEGVSFSHSEEGPNKVGRSEEERGEEERGEE